MVPYNGLEQNSDFETYTDDGGHYGMSGVSDIDCDRESSSATPRKYANYVKVYRHGAAETGVYHNIYAKVDGIIAEGKDVGTYPTPLAAPLYHHNDATGNMDPLENGNCFVAVTGGKLVITPLELTITTESDSKKYDGTALTKGKGTVAVGETTTDITDQDTEVVIVPGEDAEEETLSIKVDGSQTEVGKSDNTYTIDWNKGTASKRNYKITDKLGTLEVTPDKYTITYDPNGGKFRGSTKPTKVECAADADTTIAEAPVRKGYEFLYWKGSKYQPGDKYTVTADHTFVAQWKKNEEKGNNTSGETKKHKGVATGDYVRMGFCLFLMAITGVYLVRMSMIFRRRRRPLRR